MSMMVFFALLLAAVQLGVLSFTVRLFRSERNLLAVAFFAFAAACSLLSTLYWAAYDLLRGDARMPFAANEICEWALFLLLASSLRAARPESRVRIEAAVSAALFAAANTALWIAWSGEWLQDILTGLSLGWLFYAILAAMSAAEALSRAERIGFGAAAVLVIAAQAMTFFVSGSQAPEVVCNVLLFAADAWLILKTVVSLKKGGAPMKSLCLSFAVFAWSTVAMYMNGGAYYLIALLLAALSFPLMLLSLREEVSAS